MTLESRLFHIPEPHPLDYDWRYTSETVSSLYNLLPKQGRILAVGAPSIARTLEGSGRDVLLVDRQPLQGVVQHLVGEPGSLDCLAEGCVAAIVDPPWYVADWRRWTAWTACSVGVGGNILVSLWPTQTRPNAAQEMREIHKWASEWSEVSVLPLDVSYERPPFELAAVACSDAGDLATSPGFGQLLNLRVQQLPRIEQVHERRECWVRFVVNDYQLAVRVEGDATARQKLAKHPAAKDWYWPYVSKRASGREKIGIWSSQNEVGVVENGKVLANALRAAFNAPGSERFELALAEYAGLLEWRVPRPPYWRIFEWQHLQ